MSNDKIIEVSAADFKAMADGIRLEWGQWVERWDGSKVLECMFCNCRQDTTDYPHDLRESHQPDCPALIARAHSNID